MQKDLPYGSFGSHVRLDENATHKVIELLKPLLAVAQPIVSSAEEFETLPQETVIRSVKLRVVRERCASGWLATGANGFESSDDISERNHVVLYRPIVDDA